MRRLAGAPATVLASLLALAACSQEPGGESPVGPPENTRPTATLSELVTAEDTQLDFVLTATDPDGDPISFQVTEAPGSGALVGAPPELTYVPAPDFHGVDRFAYTVSDADGAGEPALVEVTVTPVNDAPVAEDAFAATEEGEPVTFDLSATDVDGDALSFELEEPDSGSVVLLGGGPSVSYAPAPGFAGVASFAYRVTDGALSSAATASVTVEAVVPPSEPPVFLSAPPTATAFPFELRYDAVAADEDGDPIAFTAPGLPGSLTLTDHGDGTATLSGDVRTAAPSGDVRLTLVASDGTNATEQEFVVDRLPHALLKVVPSVAGTNVGAEFDWSARDLDGTALDCEMDLGYGDVKTDCFGNVTIFYPNVYEGAEYTGGFRVTDVHGNVQFHAFAITTEPRDCPFPPDMYVCMY